MRSLWSSTALVVIALLQPSLAWSAPQGGLTVGGAATISTSGNATTVTQSSQRAIIDWRSFDVGAHESVTFVQPGRDSLAVNRIQDNKASRIDGTLSANGTVMLLNQNGVLFGNTARVDVGGIVTAAADLDNPDAFMAGAAARLSGSVAGASVINRGRITTAPGGLAGFVAPHVENTGIITAQLGRVQMAAGQKTTVDLAGDGLIEIAMTNDALARSLRNGGVIHAEGGAITLTAAAARTVVESLIDNTGTLRADTSGSVKGGISLKGEGATIKNTGTVAAEGAAGEAGGKIDLSGRWVSLGGTVSARGAAAGGQINIDAGSVSLAGLLDASSTQGSGGAITTRAAGNIWATSSASLKADGFTGGGRIAQLGGRELITSASYSAQSAFGQGGLIDITAPAVKMLSATVDASGATRGGQIRIGGEYQGGKNLPAGQDELPNALMVTLDRGTRLRADGKNADSAGGRVITWSDRDTLTLADISARPGLTSGQGGFVELSSGGVFGYSGTIQAGVGNRRGSVLLDPKNILIAEGTLNASALIMGRGYTGASSIPTSTSESQGSFGEAVALDGTQMAIGYKNADSADGLVGQAGAVYLYTFSDTSFGSGSLQGIIGHGYVGGKNVDLSSYLEGGDAFGSSVSLDGNRLAVGATGDDGSTNSQSNSGSVYLFSFSDGAFSGGTLQSRIGYGYTGGKNYNLSSALSASDQFGRAVSLDGNRLAAGAPNGDGATNAVTDSGEVYLFSFSDSAFSTPTLQARIGSGYTGGKNLSASLNASDFFGFSLSLNGNRLAVGAYGGDGATNAVSVAGEVYLYSFTDSVFSGGVLEAMMGSGYTGGKNVNLSGALEVGDSFGYAVSLDGNRLAVGAYNDDGNTNASSNSGAVYLYDFTDSVFSSATLQARIGNNYAALGGKNLSRPTEAAGGDGFGTSVALDGTRLVAGAVNDSGLNDFNGGQGAYHFYTFTDNAFSGGAYQGTIGTGYTGGKNISFPVSTSGDTEMSTHMSVSLSNNRLAIGMPDDDGFGNAKLGSGAVYLYSFSSNAFDGAVLEAIVGSGYTGGKNVDLSSFLDAGDRFGFSVSLDGNRLAVGAPYDDGNANSVANSGAAYLLTFSDSAFNGGVLQSRIGRGYSGGKNFSPANLVGISDLFGSAIALQGTRLAVGAYGDDGNANARSASGAVYLFTFADSLFSTPTQRGLIGYNYTGAGDYNISALSANDNLGLAGLSLDGGRLAITAMGDDGSGDTRTDSGAVYLFSFANGAFDNLTLEAIAGYGYTGGKNINISALANSDALSSVALEGNTLAIGSSRDDGATNAVSNSGAVYVYTFNDLLFNGAALQATIGSGYTGGNNINLSSQLNSSDQFARTLDLDGGALVIAAPGGDGNSNLYPSTGDIYIFRNSGSSPIASGTFSSVATGTLGLSPSALAALLSTPQDVTLQASNDITVNGAIDVNNPYGNGGTLTLQAGRSILINADITTDNGNLNLYANEALSTGVIDAQRDPGAATITMAAGADINAGSGQVAIRLDNGAGKTNTTSGDISLRNVTAGSILVQSADQLSNVILNGVLSASGTGTAVTVAAGRNFTNNYGAGALATPNGRWLVYSDSPQFDTLGGLAPDFTMYRCAYSGSCTIPGTGNGMLYQYGQNLLRASVNATRYYGDSNPALAALQSAYTYTGFVNGDTAAVLDVLPTATIDGTANATAAAGTVHGITLSGGSDNFYDFYYLDAPTSTLTITKKPVTISALTPLTRVYGAANPVYGIGDFSYSGFANGDTSSVITAFNTNYGAVTTATGVGSYSLGLSATADNYTFTTASLPFSITKRGITASWTAPLSRVYGDTNPAITSANFTFSGLVNGDAASVISATGDYGGVGQTTSVGSYNVSAAFSANNYEVTNTPQTTLTITKRDITATVNNASRAYGSANPSWNWSDVVWGNLANGETGSVIDAVTVAAPTATATSNAGTTHAITLDGFSDNNYNLTTVNDGVLTINKAALTLYVDNASRQANAANPAFTYTLTGLRNGDAASVVSGVSLATAATSASPVGDYAITASGGTAMNYDITSYLDGVLTVTASPVAPVPDSVTAVLARPMPTPASFTGRQHGAAGYTVISNAAAHDIRGFGASTLVAVTEEIKKKFRLLGF